MRGHNQRFQTSRSRVPNAYGGRKGDSNGVHLSTREQVPAICDGSKKSIKNIFSNIFKICEISFPGIHRDSFIFACIVDHCSIHKDIFPPCLASRCHLALYGTHSFRCKIDHLRYVLEKPTHAGRPDFRVLKICGKMLKIDVLGTSIFSIFPQIFSTLKSGRPAWVGFSRSGLWCTVNPLDPEQK